MTLTEELVDWAYSLRLDAVPAHVRVAACRCLLDGFGTTIAAVRSGEGQPAIRVAAALAGPPEATILCPQATAVSAPAAALANGTLVHALDFDDTHAAALVHATAAVLPTALAVGQAVGASGRDVLEAAIAGYETVIRLGAAVRHGFHARGFHATSVCGVFASALVASRLSRLDPARTVQSLGIAGSQASGSLEFLHTGSSTKQLHAGWAAHAGIIASRLAAEGATGPTTILEGGAGLFELYAGTSVDPSRVTGGLGEDWTLTGITIKPYPACQLSHASLDALRSLRHQFAPQDVDEITVDLPQESIPIVFEPTASKIAPRSSYEAKFSLQWSAAVLLLDGRLDLDSYSPEQLARLDARRLAQRIRAVATHPATPAADAPGRVEVKLADGRVVTGKVERSRGGPGNPMSDEQLLEKFNANCGRSDAGAHLAKLVLALGDAANADELAGAAVAAIQETV